MRIAIDKSKELTNLALKRAMSKRKIIHDKDKKSNDAVFYDWGVEKDIEFLGFSDGGNSRFVDSLFTDLEIDKGVTYDKKD